MIIDFSKEISKAVREELDHRQELAIKADEYPEYMNKGQASEYIGVSRNTLDMLIKSHGLPVIEIQGTRTVRISKRALNEYMESNTIK
ncbi:excisionase family DNA-binding protein [Limosilactobacillus equigenerosi]|uniref:Helix-turn-helix domain-containing protein n=1 Tax=Limosilactobacillus equigenerosi DSM 18793 = JCM 14505 TaxID=1423742 RepID=A0A0R1UTR8_9LACO|nr:excisionase family DNA-binding protein [Limosilactobacillus equigenerosi]KRL96543.1 hypothetical protein FC21_GL000915 [Limosilactobacillus equigenerosi DSM 18793 = JCM 14505]